VPLLYYIKVFAGPSNARPIFYSTTGITKIELDTVDFKNNESSSIGSSGVHSYADPNDTNGRREGTP